MPRTKTPAPAAAPDVPAQPAGSAPPVRPSRLQMADIARLAHVSISTVSRALANNPRLSEQTRQRVNELARSLNYTVDAGAQMMRGKQLQTVAVAFPYHPVQRQHFKDPFFLALIGSIGDALIDSGHNMLIVPVQADRFDLLTKPYETRQAIGTILLGQENYHARINELAVRGLPVVVWGARMSDQLYCSVGSDNVLGGQQATEHLLAGGARRVLFIGDVSLPEMAQRHQGYERAHQARGLALDAQLVPRLPFQGDEIQAGVERLLRERVPFDAVFACSDVMALRIMATLKAHGLQVPQDVQVVGYDDIALAAQTVPPLTTVRQTLDSAGKALVRLLLDKIEGRAVEPLVMPTELCVRGSTRAVTP